MSLSESVLMDRFRNGVMLEAEKRNMPLWTMIKHYDLPLALQSVFKGKNCLTPTMEETARKLGLDVFQLLGVQPRKQKLPLRHNARAVSAATKEKKSRRRSGLA